MPPKIKITSKKRTAHDAGLNDNNTNPVSSEKKKEVKQQQDQDIEHLAQSGVVKRYETEVPHETDEDELKRLRRKDYQKKKVKKQKLSKKGLEVVHQDNDLVKLQNSSPSTKDNELVTITDLTYHMGIANKRDDLRLLKKKKRLNLNLLDVDEDKDVLLQDDDIQNVIQNPKNKLLFAHDYNNIHKKEFSNQKEKNKQNANYSNHKRKRSMLSNELNSQLALLNSLADKHEEKVHTKIQKEKSKIEFFEDKERKKLEKKEKEKQIRNLVLNEVRQKQKQEKQTKKDLQQYKD